MVRENCGSERDEAFTARRRDSAVLRSWLDWS